MSNYVTDAFLAQTACDTLYPDLSLRCVVVSTTPLRLCEFHDAWVFTAVASLTARAVRVSTSKSTHIRVNFYGAWARAAAFIDPGDVLLLNGFARLTVPPVAVLFAEAHDNHIDNKPVSTQAVALCPLPADQSTLRVLQPGQKGDVMEVSVDPLNGDAIRMRGLPQSDTSNHGFVRDCVEARKQTP